MKDLSGGQQRRLQLLLVLLDQPNVLILDEPTNDMDTDMLAALEDLLDSWPGTLLVVSHDRYFIERVTDQQYAVLDGRLRHLPGGVDEYLKLRAAPAPARQTIPVPERPSSRVAVPERAPAKPARDEGRQILGAERRAAEKELASLERRMTKLQSEIAAARTALADHDQSDYVGLAREMEQIGVLESELQQAEERWLELSELVG